MLQLLVIRKIGTDFVLSGVRQTSMNQFVPDGCCLHCDRSPNGKPIPAAETVTTAGALAKSRLLGFNHQSINTSDAQIAGHRARIRYVEHKTATI